ncbi:hypothetical protein EV359DRAFT_32030 [Lentinula novae-zelandiae]|nr:hypothetical protein EV359DRAFT_32030 [Lentinula novae-zelandiae]
MPSAQATKKRKPQDAREGEPSALPKKKYKRNPHILDVSGQDKNDKSKGKGKEGKGKGKETAFQVVQSSLVVSLSPVFASNPRTGVEEMLDSMIMRYIPALDGVVLSHSNLTFKEDTAAIQADSPFLICNIIFDATVWRPLVGMQLVGKISLCSPDHISLLVHKTFNVSIPRHHIPTQEWEFEYGAAENDPEFGAGAGVEGMRTGSELDDGEGNGRWIHKVTASSIGGEDGYLEFTVIGLTVANEMLSLMGSLHRDPFSSVHVPSNGTQNREVEEEQEEQDVVDGFLNEMDEDHEGSDEDIESDQDGFEALNRKQSDVNAERSWQTAAEREKEEEQKKKKKKKRKADEVVNVEESQKSGKKKQKTGKSDL